MYDNGLWGCQIFIIAEALQVLTAHKYMVMGTNKTTGRWPGKGKLGYLSVLVLFKLLSLCKPIGLNREI